MKHQKTFSIGETSEMTGISKRQLRDWEGKHIPEPLRISVGERLYRRYTLKDINRLKEIKEHLGKGFTLPAAAEIASEILAAQEGGEENE
jgi:DNA-binding transcriptional MerR regulator